MRREMVGALVAALPMTVLVGCTTPAQPRPADWRRDARHALSDAAAQAGTAELVLRARDGDRFVGRYDVVVLATSEEAAGTAAQTVSAAQPPPAERSRASTVTDLLDETTSLIADAREAVAAGEPDACSRYCAELARLVDRLHALEQVLQGPVGAR